MSIELEILQYNYWEHFKSAKELSLILPATHPKRIAIDKDLNIIIDKIHKIKSYETQSQ